MHLVGDGIAVEAELETGTLDDVVEIRERVGEERESTLIEVCSTTKLSISRAPSSAVRGDPSA